MIEHIEKIFILAVGLLFALIILIFGDYFFHTEITSKCRIKGKHYQPAYTSTSYTNTGKVNIPRTEYHSEEYRVVTEIENQEEIDYSLSKDEYDKLQINNIKTCIYNKTKFLGIKYGRFIND